MSTSLSKKVIFSFMVLALLLINNSCVKPPEYPLEPVIQFVSMDKNLVKSNADSVTITLSFTDGDGNLSFEDGYTETNIFVLDTSNNPHRVIGPYTGELDTLQTLINTNVLLTDSRTGFIYNYTLPYIKVRNEETGISGEIYIVFKTLSCRPFIPPDPTPLEIDTLSLAIQILDKADNFSNIVHTPLITIDCK